MTLVDVKPITCPRCDFGTGHRGMDWCSKCAGTGSVFWARGKMFPNTQEGYREAVYIANYDGDDHVVSTQFY